MVLRRWKQVEKEEGQKTECAEKRKEEVEEEGLGVYGAEKMERGREGRGVEEGGC